MNWKAWLLPLWLILASSSSSADVVANTDLPDPSKDEVVRAFTGRLKQWSSGEVAVVYVLPRDHTATRTFVYEVLGITPSAFEDLYEGVKANQQRTQMKMLESEMQMFRAVASTIGAIGYMNNTLLINSGNGYVKVIRLR